MPKVFSKILLSFILCAGVWVAGLLWFVSQIPLTPPAVMQPADAIIVLTGGSNRLEAGLRLLAEGKGKKLFISGVHDNIDLERLVVSHSTPDIRDALLPNARENIILGHEAENTIGNAEETIRWLKKEGYHSIWLVTANYHMPRSAEEFAKIAPELTVHILPVSPEDFVVPGWWQDTISRKTILVEYHKYLASKVRHLVISMIRRS